MVLLAGRAPLLASAADGTVRDAVGIVFTIIRIICAVLGGFFIVFGIVKVAIAHANENPQEQTKALMMMAAGIVLVVLVTLVLNSAMADKISEMIEASKDLT